MADRVFACALKVYSLMSSRRASTDMRYAQEKGYISHAPHYSAVNRYMEDPDMTPILKALIVKSALPLASVEVDFIPDSSGFTTSRFVKWVDHKYGVVKQQYDWVKVHAMTGAKTNIVTCAEVGGRYDGDCPHFVPMLKTTAENFKVREVPADGAYCSYENMDLVAALGGSMYVNFRANSTADRGGMMAKMFHLYNFKRDEYLAHYHMRSNVESTFMMMKTKFGDSIKSKSDPAMVNEALAKVLCHNIVCLISSIFELGINPVFWQDEVTEPPVEWIDVEEYKEDDETVGSDIEAMAWL